MSEKSVVVRDRTMKENVEFKLNKKQKNAMAVVMALIVLITVISLVCAFLNLGILGCIATLSVFTFVFIRFLISYSQLKDMGFKSRGIEVFRVVVPIVYVISFVLNVFSI